MFLWIFSEFKKYKKEDPLTDLCSDLTNETLHHSVAALTPQNMSALFENTLQKFMQYRVNHTILIKIIIISGIKRISIFYYNL